MRQQGGKGYFMKIFKEFEDWVKKQPDFVQAGIVLVSVALVILMGVWGFLWIIEFLPWPEFL